MCGILGHFAFDRPVEDVERLRRLIGSLDPDGIDIERAFFALVHDAMAVTR